MSNLGRAAWVAVFCVLAATARVGAQAAPTPVPSPSAHESLSDAWWTGPMLAPGAGTLPHGHVLAEPYVFDVMQYGSYDANGKLSGTAHSNTFGSLTYLIYGVTDRLSVGVIPTASYTTVRNGPNSTGIGFGDTGILAQYRLAQKRPGSWVPTTSVAIQESIPNGKYEQLGSNPNNGVGSGAYSTKISLYTQTYWWMPNGRILRFRVNASQSFSGHANVDGVSVYGTSAAFHGFAAPGNAFTLDVAQEYSVTSNWVLALDEVYNHGSNTQVVGNTSVTNSGTSYSYYLAPAIEYNWNANVGLLFGTRLVPAGRNASATFTPAIALDIVR